MHTRNFVPAVIGIALELSWAGPALAAGTGDRIGEPMTAKVSYADLDLLSPDGQATLSQRVSSAAKKMCKSAPASTIPLYQMIWEKQCLKTAIRSAEPQMTAAIFRARGTPKLAAGSQSFVVRVP